MGKELVYMGKELVYRRESWFIWGKAGLYGGKLVYKGKAGL